MMAMRSLHPLQLSQVAFYLFIWNKCKEKATNCHKLSRYSAVSVLLAFFLGLISISTLVKSAHIIYIRAKTFARWKPRAYEMGIFYFLLRLADFNHLSRILRICKKIWSYFIQNSSFSLMYLVSSILGGNSSTLSWICIISWI